MKAVLLAAGVGRRLAGTHDDPKCLLRFGGRSLLERHLHCLATLGVEEVIVCVGHRADRVQAELATLGAADRVTLVHNPEYERGSIVTLWAARAHLGDAGGVLVMDADVLYHARILERLLTADAPGCALADREFEAGEEPVKLCVADGRPVELRKRLPPALRYDWCGESVGFFRFDGSLARHLARRTEAYRDAGRDDEPHEEAVRDLLLEFPQRFAVADITGLPWIEIDFVEDIARAEREILPRIDA